MPSLNNTRILILISLRNIFSPIFFIIIHYFEYSFKTFLCFHHQSHKAHKLKNQHTLQYLYKNNNLLLIIRHPYPKETHWTISSIKFLYLSLCLYCCVLIFQFWALSIDFSLWMLRVYFSAISFPQDIYMYIYIYIYIYTHSLFMHFYMRSYIIILLYK